MPRFKRRLRVTVVACMAAMIGGCGILDERTTRASTPLVNFLYGREGQVPKRDAPVELELPIRVGVAFLPAREGATHTGPGATDEQRALEKVRESFKTLPYVREIVAIPSYYLSNSRGSNLRSDGMLQLQQLARLQDLDLIALVSYDQYSETRANRRALAYLTIVGALAVRGTHNETHTIVDLAVVDPRQRSLVLRAGGVSSASNTVAAIDQSQKLRKQERRGFDAATDDMIQRFRVELTDFESRVRAGTADVRVVRRESRGPSSGGGAMDPALLLFLGGCVLAVALPGRRLRRKSPGAPGSP
jgi:rhombotail lipoprotein